MTDVFRYAASYVLLQNTVFVGKRRAEEKEVQLWDTSTMRKKGHFIGNGLF